LELESVTFANEINQEINIGESMANEYFSESAEKLIRDIVEVFPQIVTRIWVLGLILFLIALILITSPIWILPYAIYKAVRS